MYTNCYREQSNERYILISNETLDNCIVNSKENLYFYKHWLRWFLLSNRTNLIISVKSSRLIVIDKNGEPNSLFQKYYISISLASNSSRAYRSLENAYEFAMDQSNFVVNTRNASNSVYFLTFSIMLWSIIKENVD